MRNAFAKQIEILAEQDERVVLLMGDIGNRLFNRYRDRFPNRFFNAGVAEANMVTMAAGMAAEGLRPFCYTIAPFVTSRCYEQIKVDLGYHHQPVVLVGTGAGLSYASLGATHHSLEDIALMRTVPGMTVLCPGDATELEALLPQTLGQSGPIYIRLGKKGEPRVHDAPPALEIGKAFTVHEGHDVCVLSTGNLLPVAMETAERLREKSVSCRVVSLHTVKPLDETFLQETFDAFRFVATMEEHGQCGGLGAAIAECYAEQPGREAILSRFSAPDEFLHLTADQGEAREHFGLTAAAIARSILAALSTMCCKPSETYR